MASPRTRARALRRLHANNRWRPMPRLGFHTCAQRNEHRNRLYGLQRSRCYLCTGLLRNKADKSFDHVRPDSRLKGRTMRERRANLLLAHPPCNQAKGDREPYACELLYLVFVQERLADPCGAAAAAERRAA